MANYPSDATATFSVVYNMTNRKPDRGLPYTREFNNRIFTSQSGHEARSNVSRRPKRSFNFTYSNISGGYKKAIENFYADRQGTFESFYLDLSHINESGSVLVRFDGSLNITQVFAQPEEERSIYTITFSLTETYN